MAAIGLGLSLRKQFSKTPIAAYAKLAKNSCPATRCIFRNLLDDLGLDCKLRPNRHTAKDIKFVQYEITPPTREAVAEWIKQAHEEHSGGAIAFRTYQAGTYVQYLGIVVEDALELSEQTEV